MFYTTRVSEYQLIIGSYLSEATAKQYSPTAHFHDMVIKSQDVGFPLEDLVVRGYAVNDKGKFPTDSYTGELKEYSVYARTADGNWALVHTHDSFSFSRMATQYKEIIFIESHAPLTASPLELIPNLSGDVVELRSEPVNRRYPFVNSDIYD